MYSHHYFPIRRQADGHIDFAFYHREAAAERLRVKARVMRSLGRTLRIPAIILLILAVAAVSLSTDKNTARIDTVAVLHR